jgi:hypothetical protein
MTTTSISETPAKELDRGGDMDHEAEFIVEYMPASVLGGHEADERKAGLRVKVQQDHRSGQYREAEGRSNGAAGDVTVSTPTEPPRLNPAAARVLLRILIKVSTSRRAQP